MARRSPRQQIKHTHTHTHVPAPVSWQLSSAPWPSSTHLAARPSGVFNLPSISARGLPPASSLKPLLTARPASVHHDLRSLHPPLRWPRRAASRRRGANYAQISGRALAASRCTSRSGRPTTTVSMKASVVLLPRWRFASSAHRCTVLHVRVVAHGHHHDGGRVPPRQGRGAGDRRRVGGDALGREHAERRASIPRSSSSSATRRARCSRRRSPPASARP